MSIMLIIVLLLVLAAEFVNGWTDAPNAIATVVSTRVLSPRNAILMATLLNIVGALAGTAVAETIGTGIVEASVINLQTVAAAMFAIVIWSSLAAHYGIPTSESHALVAGLAGAGLATAGPHVLLWSGWQKVLIGLVLSSFLGFGSALIIAKAVQIFLANSSPIKSRRLFARLQILSAAFMAFNHGLNDGQKFIGVFALALTLAGIFPGFHIPVWVILICALTMGIGTSFGGRKIIHKMGIKMVHLESWQGFSAETAASLTILGASHFGIPLSTTHSIGTAIMGVGAARRFSAVRWNVSQEIVMAWVLTFPICGTIAFLIALLLKLMF
ncbi:MAG: inorganic phosphate transporter [Candidatus Tectomicrobia bacterium]|uniref:Inorganic phosphate transporter n=1 Tax=Tectimicrobiota bacterium TaxID=2528274 RepID=A0A932GNX1_UNCTE|nr:inorganic phosphate transporter [Candidatus Tectomicrobia bacterium]